MLPQNRPARVRSKLGLKSRLFVLAVLGALVCATEASALQLDTVTRKAIKTTSRQAIFDCGFRGNYGNPPRGSFRFRSVSPPKDRERSPSPGHECGVPQTRLFVDMRRLAHP